MRERVLAIVNLIAQYVLGAEEPTISEQELMTELMSVGFDADEINDAFSWMETIALQPQSESAIVSPLMEPPTYRIFSAQEQQQLTTAARGFLVKVRTMGLLSDAAQEEIIDRALRSTNGPINEQEIKIITTLTLLSHSSNLWLREI
ncbi:MAG: DUF494 family protein, partial [Desulfuromusa sp.]|nr:DUF494 family protein [Desulfuromusa sp.]